MPRVDPFEVAKLDMADMFEEARAKGLMFHCSYQDLWFTPDELEEEQRNGRFRWGRVNWELVDPSVRTEALKKKMAAAEQELKDWLEKIGGVK